MVDVRNLDKSTYKKILQEQASHFSRVLIYGAGVRGKLAYEVMKECKLPVYAFVVTDVTVNLTAVNDTPVIGVDNLTFDNATTLFLLGVKARFYSEVIENLRQYGFENYLELPDDVTGWGSSNPDINGSPWLEITTKIGCSVNCHYCPQSVLASNYGSNERMMSMSIFKRCLSNVPSNVLISYSGFCEPFLNPDCTEMIKYADSLGYRQALYTTLVGMTENDFTEIKDIPFSEVVIHLPDKDNLANIPVTGSYIRLLQEVVSYCRRDGQRFAIRANCQSEPNETIKELLQGQIQIFSEMNSRAGNLDDKNLVSTPYLHGSIACSRVMNKFVLLPDGRLALCCMDFSLRHIVGSLLDDTYIGIVQGQALRKLKGYMVDDTDCLCRQCIYARHV